MADNQAYVDKAIFFFLNTQSGSYNIIFEFSIPYVEHCV
jgi:hypothetical protein